MGENPQGAELLTLPLPRKLDIDLLTTKVLPNDCMMVKRRQYIIYKVCVNLNPLKPEMMQFNSLYPKNMSRLI